MQVRAIFEAAVALQKSKRPVIVKPEIMVPLVGFDAELRDQVAIVRAVADEVLTKAGIEVPYQVGTMIEVPRAAITADEIAETAEFFSFGTNDLTQTTLGLSRDDMGSFFDVYRDKEIYGHNPFASIDEAGVGRLMRTAIRGGRDKRSNLKLGHLWGARGRCVVDRVLRRAWSRLRQLFAAARASCSPCCGSGCAAWELVRSVILVPLLVQDRY